MFIGSRDCFVARVGTKQIRKIKTRLQQEFSFKTRAAAGKNFQDTIVDLSKSITNTSVFIRTHLITHNLKTK